MKRLLVFLNAALLLAALVGCGQPHSYDHDHNSAPQSSAKLISKEQAKAIALEHAKMTDRPIRDFEIELDRDYKEVSYEIEFKSGGFEYDYDVDAETGKILSAKKEKADSPIN